MTDPVPSPAPHRIVIIGAGAIGLAFAAAFSDAGHTVIVAETDEMRRADAKARMTTYAEAIRLAGLAQGRQGEIEIMPDASSEIASAALVLECGPENVEIKQAIFVDLLANAAPNAVLATASSAIEMSRIVPDPQNQARCLVAHPVNPPAILRVIEVVPAPGTHEETCANAAVIFEDAGFASVILGKEIEGFVMNRLQSAVLREAYRLVEEGVADVDGIDKIMRLALGPRWALSGPFETAELNTPGGIRAHAARMGPAYKRIGEGRGETVNWNAALVARVDAERRALCPIEDLPARVEWRSDAVARLIALRDTLMDDTNG